MNLGDMRTKVRRHLGQTSATNSIYADSDVNDAINDALTEVAKETRCLLTSFDQTTSSGTERYGLNSDFLQLVAVELIVDSSLTERLLGVSYEQFAAYAYQSRDSQGRPSIYRMEYGATEVTAATPGEIVLWQVPDNNGGADYTLREVYIQMPTALSADSQISEVPRELHLGVTYYAALTLALQDNDAQRINILSGLYRRAIDSFAPVQHQRDKSYIRQKLDRMYTTRRGRFRR